MIEDSCSRVQFQDSIKLSTLNYVQGNHRNARSNACPWPAWSSIWTDVILASRFAKAGPQASLPLTLTASASPSWTSENGIRCSELVTFDSVLVMTDVASDRAPFSSRCCRCSARWWAFPPLTNLASSSVSRWYKFEYVSAPGNDPVSLPGELAGSKSVDDVGENTGISDSLFSMSLNLLRIDVRS